MDKNQIMILNEAQLDTMNISELESLVNSIMEKTVEMYNYKKNYTRK